MLTEKFYDVLKHEGVVTVVSWGDSTEPHIANTWNSYLVVTNDERILIPAYGFRKTEKNVNVNNKIKMALGTKEVLGYKDYQGTGFVVEGTAKYLTSGLDFDMMKEKFSFTSRVVEVTVTSAKYSLPARLDAETQTVLNTIYTSVSNPISLITFDGFRKVILCFKTPAPIISPPYLQYENNSLVTTFKTSFISTSSRFSYILATA